MTTDKILLYEITHKNRSAFTEFYNRYENRMYRIAFARLGNKESTEDFLQDFWKNVWMKPEIIKTNEKDCALGFLYCLLTKRILDNFRKRSKYITIEINEFLSEIAEIEPRYTHIIEEITVKEIIDITEKVMKSLPETDRKIFSLYKNNYSVSEIARNLSMSEGTIKNKLSVINQNIRMNLKPLHQLSTSEAQYIIILLIFSSSL